MHIRHNPETMAPPYSNYVNGTEVAASKRWLYVSGQCGVRPDGSIPLDFETQCEVAMDNVLAVLAAADMRPEDVVKVSFFMTDRNDLQAARTIRDRKLNNVAVSSTLILIAGMILPEFKIEIECTAAR